MDTKFLVTKASMEWNEPIGAFDTLDAAKEAIKSHIDVHWADEEIADKPELVSIGKFGRGFGELIYIYEIEIGKLNSAYFF